MPTAYEIPLKNRFRFADYLRRVKNKNERETTLQILENAPDEWYMAQLRDIQQDILKSGNRTASKKTALFQDASFLIRTMWDRILGNNTRTLVLHPKQTELENIIKNSIQALQIDISAEPFSSLAKAENHTLVNIKEQLLWRLYTLSQFSEKSQNREKMEEDRRRYTAIELNNQFQRAPKSFEHIVVPAP